MRIPTEAKKAIKLAESFIAENGLNVGKLFAAHRNEMNLSDFKQKIMSTKLPSELLSNISTILDSPMMESADPPHWMLVYRREIPGEEVFGTSINVYDDDRVEVVGEMPMDDEDRD